MARVVRPLAAVILVHLVLAVCGLANQLANQAAPPRVSDALPPSAAPFAVRGSSTSGVSSFSSISAVEQQVYHVHSESPPTARRLTLTMQLGQGDSPGAGVGNQQRVSDAMPLCVRPEAAQDYHEYLNDDDDDFQPTSTVQQQPATTEVQQPGTEPTDGAGLDGDGEGDGDDGQDGLVVQRRRQAACASRGQDANEDSAPPETFLLLRLLRPSLLMLLRLLQLLRSQFVRGSESH
jgi:hypothetical protein